MKCGWSDFSGFIYASNLLNRAFLTGVPDGDSSGMYDRLSLAPRKGGLGAKINSTSRFRIFYAS